MKQSEIKNLSLEDLQDKLAESQKQLTELQMAHAITPLENPLQLRSLDALSPVSKQRSLKDNTKA